MKFCSASSASASDATRTNSIRLDRVDHLVGAARDRIGEVAGHALAQRLGLADVDDLALAVAEQVDARPVGQRLALLGQAGPCDPSVLTADSISSSRIRAGRVDRLPGRWRSSTSTRTRRPGRRRRCAPPSPRPRSATSSAARTRRRAPSRSASPRCWATRRRVFLPSGTMCNEIAIRLHIRPGGERMFIGRDTHTLIAEAGGPAQLSGAVITEVDGDSGMFTPEALEHAIHGSGPGGRYGPRERLVSVEQTTNMGGGRVWPLEQVRAVLDVARASGLVDPPRRRAADERGGGQRRRRRRLGRAASTARGWTSPRASAPRSAPAWPARPPSSRRRGAGSRCWAAPCASRASSPPPGSTRSTTTSSAWPTTTRAPGAWPRGSRRCPASSSTPPRWRRTSSSSRCPTRPPSRAALAAEDVEMSHFGPTRVRAVTHLDVDDEGIERALSVAARALGEHPARAPQ